MFKLSHQYSFKVTCSGNNLKHIVSKENQRLLKYFQMLQLLKKEKFSKCSVLSKIFSRNGGTILIIDFTSFSITEIFFTSFTKFNRKMLKKTQKKEALFWFLAVVKLIMQEFLKVMVSSTNISWILSMKVKAFY